jgi:predicted dehydrogenase
VDKVRAVIAGMGIGRPNGRAIAKNPRGEVVALCDLERARMEDFAAELPGDQTLYTDYREACRDPRANAVFVGTPNQWHVPIAREAVRNGKHVLVTKPLADSVEAALQLVEEAEAAGVVNMMSLSNRFSEQCQYLGNLAADGFFGDIYYARARSVRRNGIPVWRGDQLRLGFIRKGGGAFRDMGVHVLDAAWWLMGTPKPVKALAVGGAKFGPHGRGFNKPAGDEIARQFEVDDYASGLVTFENGAGIHVESFWASHFEQTVNVELFGTEAGASMRPLSIHRMEGDPQVETPEVPSEKTGMENVADHFIDCVLDGVTCAAPLRHGLIVQQMMEAVLRSAETGRHAAVGD